ncbi:MAG: hypothetical protein O7A06_08120 [Acidobacteria bacterium]|nr:hypothetical protein [Acidobacteriota bacterium]
MKNGKKQVKTLHLSFLVSFLVIFLGLAFHGTLYGQSLVEVARQQRARKAQQDKAVKVFTNDQISRPSSSSSRTATRAAEAQKPEGEEQMDAAGTTEAGTAESAREERARLEKEYREKFAQLREELSYEERKLDVMQRELNLMQVQYYSDPNVAMREQHERGEINQRMQDLEAQKAAVEQKKAAITAMEEELRREGLPVGWSR